MPSPAPTPAIEAVGLTKRFGDFEAVRGIDLVVEPGEYFGFLGPNGAGKTSTMRMVGCVSPPTRGTLRILGHDATTDGVAIRSRLGVVPQEDNLDTELSVWENLIVYGRYFGLPRATLAERADELLDFVQLGDRRRSLVDPLSGGMRRRLAIARALINRPDLLLLDEPTTGLDPQARHLVWERIFRLKAQGVTMVLTTHYMDEAEQLCDRLVVMDEGRIVAQGSPGELIREHSTREVLELRFADPAASTQVAEVARSVGRRVEALTERLLVYADDGDAALAVLTDRGARPDSVLIRRSTLEDVFLHLTGRTLVD